MPMFGITVLRVKQDENTASYPDCRATRLAESAAGILDRKVPTAAPASISVCGRAFQYTVDALWRQK
jgi:hypothetical protein